MDNNATEFLLSVADRTLNAANAATSAINTYLVLSGIIIAFVAFVSALVSIWLSQNFKKEKKHLLEEAKNNLLGNIAKDDNIRNALINKILDDDLLLKKIISLNEFREQLDVCVADHIDILKEYDERSRLDGAEGYTCDDEAILKDIDITIDNEVNFTGGKNGVK